jgi:hypothetical protein
MSPALPAQTAPPSVVNGFYSGSYVCGSVITRFDVTLTASPNGALAATFTVYPADGSGSFTYDLKGGYNPQFGNFNLQPQKKEGVTPPVSLVGMTGRFIPEGGLISGTMLLGRCGSYTATRHPPGTPAPAPKAAPSLPAAPTTPDRSNRVGRGTPTSATASRVEQSRRTHGDPTLRQDAGHRSDSLRDRTPGRRAGCR